MKKNVCRYCGKTTRKIVSLGSIPLVNYFPKKGEVTKPKRYPLDLMYCPACELGQTGITVPPKRIFSPYHYVTGSSAPLVAHLSESASFLRKQQYVTKGSSVLDIGCNDGTLLSAFKKFGCRVLGVDPAKNIAPLAASKGIPVVTAFFGQKSAVAIVKEHGQFDCVTVTHTLANIPDLNDFFRGLGTVIKPGGTLALEVASFEDMVIRGQIDAVYHEHYCYFSEASLVRLLRDGGFGVVSIRRDAAQGGSTMIIAKRGHIGTPVRVRRISSQALSSLRERTAAYRRKFRTMLRKYRGMTVVGFGAPAKAVTLLNWLGITGKDIAFVVDSTPAKQGRLIPGVEIPVYPEAYIAGKQIDAIVLLSWNYQEEILMKLAKLIRTPIRVIFPFPKLRIYMMM